MEPISFTAVFLTVLAASVSSAPTVITIQSIADFARYNFSCIDGPTSNCTFKSVANAAQIPPYFPAEFRQLSFPYMYVEGTGSNSYYEALTPVLDARILKWEVEYASVGQAVGYKPFNRASGLFFPATQAGSGWVKALSPHEVALNNGLRMHGFAFRNNRNNILGVFRKLTMTIDPEPQLQWNVDKVSDFRSGNFACEGPFCTINSVSNANLLPSYFPTNYRSLPSELGKQVMYLEPSQTNFPPPVYNLMINESWRFVSDTQGVIVWDAEYYMEQENVFGYGPSQPNLIWYNFEKSTLSAPRQWTDTRNAYFGPYSLGLRYALTGGRLTPIGFFAFNNMRTEYVVFRRLSISIYCEPGDIVGPPLTTTTTTTTRATTTTTTTRPTTTTTLRPTTTSTNKPTTTTTRTTTTRRPSPNSALTLGVSGGSSSHLLALAIMSFILRLLSP